MAGRLGLNWGQLKAREQRLFRGGVNRGLVIETEAGFPAAKDESDAVITTAEYQSMEQMIADDMAPVIANRVRDEVAKGNVPLGKETEYAEALAEETAKEIIKPAKASAFVELWDDEQDLPMTYDEGVYQLPHLPSSTDEWDGWNPWQPADGYSQQDLWELETGQQEFTPFESRPTNWGPKDIHRSY